MAHATSDDYVRIAVMGMTGTGKSTFIHLLTNDNNIRIGHDPDSETSDVQTTVYTDSVTGKLVMLIDTPGFDDSREGVTDAIILERIVRYLEPQKGQGTKLNGIIYMHRISDPRVGGLARKNIRMLQALCGEKTLRNIRVVTTFWEHAVEQHADSREDHLKQRAFKPLLDAGARMLRHANNIESARAIMSELIPLPGVTTHLQDQVVTGIPLAATDSGRIINQEIEETKKKHAEELAEVKREIQEASKARDKALREELEQEFRALQGKIARTDDDRAVLMKTLDEIRAERVDNRRGCDELREKYEKELSGLRRLLEEAAQARSALERERSALEAKTAHADGQRELLVRTVEDLRAERAACRREKDELQKMHEHELSAHRKETTEAREALQQERRARATWEEEKEDLQRKFAELSSSHEQLVSACKEKDDAVASLKEENSVRAKEDAAKLEALACAILFQAGEVQGLRGNQVNTLLPEAEKK